MCFPFASGVSRKLPTPTLLPAKAVAGVSEGEGLSARGMPGTFPSGDPWVSEFHRELLCHDRAGSLEMGHGPVLSGAYGPRQGRDFAGDSFPPSIDWGSGPSPEAPLDGLT